MMKSTLISITIIAMSAWVQEPAAAAGLAALNLGSDTASRHNSKTTRWRHRRSVHTPPARATIPGSATARRAALVVGEDIRNRNRNRNI